MKTNVPIVISCSKSPICEKRDGIQAKLKPIEERIKVDYLFIIRALSLCHECAVRIDEALTGKLLELLVIVAC